MIGRGKTDPTCTLEELYWLVLLTGHVLADAGEGETPLVPEALQIHFSNIVEAALHPVVVLSVRISLTKDAHANDYIKDSIISFAEQSLDQEMRAAFFSPRVMETAPFMPQSVFFCQQPEKGEMKSTEFLGGGNSLERDGAKG
ncbi:hypothetical protein ACLOJK_009660 [Asimina triloba]